MKLQTLLGMDKVEGDTILATLLLGCLAGVIWVRHCRRHPRATDTHAAHSPSSPHTPSLEQSMAQQSTAQAVLQPPPPAPPADDCVHAGMLEGGQDPGQQQGLLHALQDLASEASSETAVQQASQALQADGESGVSGQQAEEATHEAGAPSKPCCLGHSSKHAVIVQCSASNRGSPQAVQEQAA